MKTSALTLLAVAAIARAQTAGEELTLDLGGGVKLELLRIPAGDFQMGENEVARNVIGLFSPHELRARQVVISRNFYLGKFEVTVGQFRRFAEAASYQTDAETGRRPWRGLGKGIFTLDGGKWAAKADGSWKNPGFAQDDSHPVTGVSWFDAAAFCEWVSRQTRRKCRLPSEAELEDAQRAWTVTRYFWGNNPNSPPILSAAIRRAKVGRSFWANVADSAMNARADDDLFLDKSIMMRTPVPKERDDQHAYTAPVGSMRPNPFGLYDVIGNVWEYTLDWAGPDPSGRDPRGTDSGPVRGMRGGSWLSSPDVFRPSYRAQTEPEGRTSTRGLRVLMEE